MPNNNTLPFYVAIGIGANMPDAPHKVSNAIKFLSTILANIKVSSLYTTPAAGSKSAPDYINAVLSGYSFFNIESLTAITKAYESISGRTCTDSQKGLVAIDIDIVVANTEVIRPHDFSASHFIIGYSQIS